VGIGVYPGRSGVGVSPRTSSCTGGGGGGGFVGIAVGGGVNVAVGTGVSVGRTLVGEGVHVGVGGVTVGEGGSVQVGLGVAVGTCTGVTVGWTGEDCKRKSAMTGWRESHMPRTSVKTRVRSHRVRCCAIAVSVLVLVCSERHTGFPVPIIHAVPVLAKINPSKQEMAIHILGQPHCRLRERV